MTPAEMLALADEAEVLHARANDQEGIGRAVADDSYANESRHGYPFAEMCAAHEGAKRAAEHYPALCAALREAVAEVERMQGCHLAASRRAERHEIEKREALDRAEQAAKIAEAGWRSALALAVAYGASATERCARAALVDLGVEP